MDIKKRTRVIFYINKKTIDGLAGFVQRDKDRDGKTKDMSSLAYSYLFRQAKDDLSEFAHEMGHCYDLPEAFQERYIIPEATSINIMDYPPAPKKIFWRWQWMDMRKTIDPKDDYFK